MRQDFTLPPVTELLNALHLTGAVEHELCRRPCRVDDETKACTAISASHSRARLIGDRNSRP